MFGAVDIKHPKLLPALREGVTAVRRRGAPGTIKALCRVEEPNPELAGKPCGKPKVSGNRPLANRLDCSASWEDFANDSGRLGWKGRRKRKIAQRRRGRAKRRKRGAQAEAYATWSQSKEVGHSGWRRWSNM